MAKFVADCSKYPSDMNCDLKITGSDKAAVVEAAYQHALSPTHHHAADEAGLREKIESGVTEE